MRRLIAFPCGGDTLVGTLDAAAGRTGLLIVSGGNELRIGAHRGMAALAQRLAADGIPVLRFDRRGVGDSTGDNRGFESSADDLVAAVAAFLDAAPQVARIVGFGNCDAATALALFGRAAGIDALVLSNPWLREETDALPPAAAIRSRYAERLRDPKAWLRLVRGGVDLRKLIGGLSKISASAKPADPLADRVLGSIARERPTILLARGDATAQAFAAAAPGMAASFCETGSHSYARPADQDWLYRQLRERLVAEEGLEPPTRGL